MSTEEFFGIVTYPPENGSSTWKVSQLSLAREINDHELVIRMVATGICHTDIFVSRRAPDEMGLAYPRVLGHEGAGVVEAVGSQVTAAKSGDLVILSHTHCNNCKKCSSGLPSKCLSFTRLNLMGEPAIFTTADEHSVHGKFFGQSSFAELTISDEKSVVNVTGIVEKKDLELLAPVGCGLQTGVGAVLNVGKATSDDCVLVTGLGAVGLGAVMAAKLAGCASIVAVDRVDSRLEVAKSLGATHVLNTGKDVSLAQGVKTAIGDQGISIAIDTTSSLEIISGSLSCLERWGKLILLGAPDPTATITLSMSDLFFGHKTITSSTLGDGNKIEAIPQMIDWWKRGLFPIEKIVDSYSAKTEMEDAVKGMETGAVIKPILLW